MDDEVVPTGNSTEFDKPPPCVGFFTVTEAELAVVISVGGTVAVNWVLLTKSSGEWAAIPVNGCTLSEACANHQE